MSKKRKQRCVHSGRRPTTVIQLSMWTGKHVTTRCWVCNALMPLGPANDDDPRVAVERRASLLAMAHLKTGEEDPPDVFSPSERVGWFVQFFDSLGHTDTAQTDNGELEAGYLARCIATHDQEQEAG